MFSELYQEEIQTDNGVIWWGVRPSFGTIEVLREYISIDFQKKNWTKRFEKGEVVGLENHFSGETLSFVSNILIGE